jgi:hypothetical protein
VTTAHLPRFFGAVGGGLRGPGFEAACLHVDVGKQAVISVLLTVFQVSIRGVETLRGQDRDVAFCD